MIDFLTLTRHAAIRAQQRAIPRDMMELVHIYGTEIGDNRYLMTQRDAEDAERDLNSHHEAPPKTSARHRDMIRRAAGKVVVVVDGQFVTCYHRCEKGARCTRRDARGRRAQRR